MKLSLESWRSLEHIRRNSRQRTGPGIHRRAGRIEERCRNRRLRNRTSPAEMNGNTPPRLVHPVHGIIGGTKANSTKRNVTRWAEQAALHHRTHPTQTPGDFATSLATCWSGVKTGTAPSIPATPPNKLPPVCCVAGLGAALRVFVVLRTASAIVPRIVTMVWAFAWQGLYHENLNTFFLFPCTAFARRRRARHSTPSLGYLDRQLSHQTAIGRAFSLTPQVTTAFVRFPENRSPNHLERHTDKSQATQTQAARRSVSRIPRGSRNPVTPLAQ